MKKIQNSKNKNDSNKDDLYLELLNSWKIYKFKYKRIWKSLSNLNEYSTKINETKNNIEIKIQIKEIQRRNLHKSS